MEYRNELKFEVSELELNKIKYRLMPIMQVDRNQEADGYLIRSIYFEDIYNTYMAENESGVGQRRKYRIRIYNKSSDVIHLEKKSKYHNMTQKEKQVLTKAQCDALISGNWDFFRENNIIESGTLLEEIYLEALRRQLSPKCIVEYERFAFVEDVGNVRITFDRNIRGSLRTESFFDNQIIGTPVMPTGRHILEIKYDELLPQYILQAIDIGNLRRQSFSKYYAARVALR